VSPVTPEQIQKALAWNETSARRLCPNRADDLVEAGYAGIAQAIARYDASKGSSFAHYVGFWIKNFHLQAFRQLRSPASVPENVAGKFPGVGLEEIADMISEQHEPDLDIETYLGLLHERERRLVVAHYLRGESVPQLAKKERLSVSQTAFLIRRAIARIRKLSGSENE
jgi:RNA polymerase sporulation-specific sigma factor